jgi:hypothetical protein
MLAAGKLDRRRARDGGRPNARPVGWSRDQLARHPIRFLA